MTAKVLIKRRVAKEKQKELLPLILELRTLATLQPGYMSGETLRNAKSPDEYLVISTWRTVDAWKAWEESNDRAQVQEKIDSLLGEETEFEIYYYPD
jgi:antibiotic biosynthesis monooxygenase (ABM) superfamily enzyme